jgi:PAS domain-containing protein
MLSWRQSNDQAGPKIRLQARSWRSASSALLPVATAALAAGVFIAEAITPMKLAVAVFYVVVVLLAARFCSARGIVLVGAGCAGLTLLAFFLPGFSETEAGGTGVKASIGVAVIGLATFLVTERKRAMETLRESEEQWKEVFEHNPVMYFMVSPTGIVMSVNAADGSETESTGHSRAHHSRPKAVQTSNCLIRTPFLRDLSRRVVRVEIGQKPGVVRGGWIRTSGTCDGASVRPLIAAGPVLKALQSTSDF